MKLTRLEEIIMFAAGIGYTHIGIAFCIGLKDEAKILCKVCAVSKSDMGVPKIKEGRYESICNPIGQAHLLNESNTDLNIICGLCIGYDILFTRHSNAPVTTFVVKDRALSYNPVGALYSNYYKNIFLHK